MGDESDLIDLGENNVYVSCFIGMSVLFNMREKEWFQCVWQLLYSDKIIIISLYC